MAELPVVDPYDQQYEIAKRKLLEQKKLDLNKTAETYGARGRFYSSVLPKQEAVIEKNATTALGDVATNIAIERSAQALADKRIKEAQEYQTEERESSQTYASAEAAIGRAFTTDEREAVQKYQTGERMSNQEWTAAENALGRKFSTSERLASEKYASGENALNRGFTTSEREAGQTYASGENALNRTAASTENTLNRSLTVSENALNRTATATENAESRAIQLAELLGTVDGKRTLQGQEFDANKATADAETAAIEGSGYTKEAFNMLPAEQKTEILKAVRNDVGGVINFDLIPGMAGTPFVYGKQYTIGGHQYTKNNSSSNQATRVS